MLNPIVDETAWTAARAALLAEEKALTEAMDLVAAKRRQLPWREVTAN